MDASRAYISVAREEADRHGHANRVRYVAGDFVALADEVQPADLVAHGLVRRLHRTTLIRQLAVYERPASPTAALPPPAGRPTPLCYHPGVPFDINGIRIPTITRDNVATRCRGCGGVIEGAPFRINIMDITAVEIPPAWSGGSSINPGPFQLHADPACARRWMRERGNLFCRKSAIRELMRPIAVPGETQRWGLCDGLHHDDHELVPA